MRVLLIVPTHQYKKYPTPLSLSDFPTGFGYLSASLKGHEVIGVNLNNLTGYPSGRIMVHSVLNQKISQYKPDLIATGGLAVDYPFLNDCIAFCRALSPGTPIVLGGQIVTNDAEFIFNDLKPDYAVGGEADKVIVDIVEGRVEKGIVKAEVIKDLDSLPFPDYEPFDVKDMLDNHSMDTRLLYRYSRPYPRPFVIVASRSCPFNCSFCVHKTREIPYRARSIPNIMAEIKETYEKYKFNILIIDDELFAVSKNRLNEFSEAIIKGKERYGWDFDWCFQCHASARFDLESLKLARKAGCYMFSYGLESASPVVLKSMNKKIKIEQVIEAIELAHQANIGFSANLIFGDIAETVDTWAESLAFWLEHGRKDFIFLTNLHPYPGSKLFEETKDRLGEKKHFYEHIDEGVVNMTQINNADMLNLLKLISNLERSWLFVGRASNVRSEVESKDNEVMYKIRGICPYCGTESLWRQRFSPKIEKFSIGTGCTNCNRKVKVEVGSNL